MPIMTKRQFYKIDVRNRAEATAYALSQGLAPPRELTDSEALNPVSPPMRVLDARKSNLPAM